MNLPYLSTERKQESPKVRFLSMRHVSTSEAWSRARALNGGAGWSLGAETMGQSGHCDQPNNENMTRIQTIYSFFRMLNITLTCEHLLYLFNVFNHPSIITIKTSVYNKIYLLHRGWTNKGRH